jgi:hypothetical protein
MTLHGQANAVIASATAHPGSSDPSQPRRAPERQEAKGCGEEVAPRPPFPAERACSRRSDEVEEPAVEIEVAEREEGLVDGARKPEIPEELAVGVLYPFVVAGGMAVVAFDDEGYNRPEHNAHDPTGREAVEL